MWGNKTNIITEETFEFMLLDQLCLGEAQHLK